MNVEDEMNDGIWALVVKPRWFLRWLPIDFIDEFLVEKFAGPLLDPKTGQFRPLPRWYVWWNEIAFTFDWEWEEIEDDEKDT